MRISGNEHSSVILRQTKWFLVVLLKFLNVCPFDYKAVAGSGKVGP